MGISVISICPFSIIKYFTSLCAYVFHLFNIFSGQIKDQINTDEETIPCYEQNMPEACSANEIPHKVQPIPPDKLREKEGLLAKNRHLFMVYYLLLYTLVHIEYLGIKKAPVPSEKY